MLEDFTSPYNRKYMADIDDSSIWYGKCKII